MYALVSTKFINKLDKQGRPYFEHCDYVRKRCGLEDEVHQCIAMGHDLIEDTDVTYEYLVEEFNKPIADGILILTHNKNIDYMVYVDSVPILSNKANLKLVDIKLADLRHNMDASRLKGFKEEDIERLVKYSKAVELLKRKPKEAIIIFLDNLCKNYPKLEFKYGIDDNDGYDTHIIEINEDDRLEEIIDFELYFMDRYPFNDIYIMDIRDTASEIITPIYTNIKSNNNETK